MKAKLLRDAGDISEGAVVEVASKAGTNDARSDEDVGGRSTKEAPVYDVTDTDGHAEKVDTRDLKLKRQSEHASHEGALGQLGRALVQDRHPVAPRARRRRAARGPPPVAYRSP